MKYETPTYILEKYGFCFLFTPSGVHINAINARAVKPPRTFNLEYRVFYINMFRSIIRQRCNCIPPTSISIVCFVSYQNKIRLPTYTYTHFHLILASLSRDDPACLELGIII